MAYETELGNIIHPTDTVAAAMTEAFVANDVVFPLVLTDVFPDDTNVIKFAKSGSLTAAGQSESTAVTFSGNHELTDTSTTATGVKKAAAAKITVENLRFGGQFASLERYGREMANALNRLAASELKTLFASIDTQTTATSTLTKDDILDSRYAVVKSMKGAFSGRMVGMFDYKGINELAKELTDITATAFVAQVDLGILGLSTAPTPVGRLFDIDMYQTDGLPTSGSDDVACIWDPTAAFCAGIDGRNGFNVEMESPHAATPWVELYAYTFWHIAEHNDTAACGVLSDT